MAALLVVVVATLLLLSLPLLLLLLPPAAGSFFRKEASEEPRDALRSDSPPLVLEPPRVGGAPTPTTSTRGEARMQVVRLRGSKTDLEEAIAALEASDEAVAEVQMRNSHFRDVPGASARLVAGLVRTSSKSLKVLYLSSCYLGDEEASHVAVRALTECPLLEAFDLDSNLLTDKFTESIVRPLELHQNLARLYLASNYELTDVTARLLAGALRVNTSLNELALSDTNITDRGVLAIVEAIRESDTCVVESVLLRHEWNIKLTMRSLARLKAAEVLGKQRNSIRWDQRHPAPPTRREPPPPPPAWLALVPKPAPEWTPEELDAALDGLMDYFESTRVWPRPRIEEEDVCRLLLGVYGRMSREQFERLVRRNVRDVLSIAGVHDHFRLGLLFPRDATTHYSLTAWQRTCTVASVLLESKRWEWASDEGLLAPTRKLAQEELDFSFRKEKEAWVENPFAKETVFVGRLHTILASCVPGDLVERDVHALIQRVRLAHLPELVRAPAALFGSLRFPRDGDHLIASRVMDFLVPEAARVFQFSLRGTLEVPCGEGASFPAFGQAVAPQTGRMALVIKLAGMMVSSLTLVNTTVTNASSSRELHSVVREFPLRPASTSPASVNSWFLAESGTAVVITYEYEYDAMGAAAATTSAQTAVPQFYATVLRPPQQGRTAVELTFPLGETVKDIRGLCIVRAPPEANVGEELVTVVYSRQYCTDTRRDGTVFLELYSASGRGGVFRSPGVWTKRMIIGDPNMSDGAFRMASHPREPLTLALIGGSGVFRVSLGMGRDPDGPNYFSARASQLLDSSGGRWNSMAFSSEGQWLALESGSGVRVVEFDTGRVAFAHDYAVPRGVRTDEVKRWMVSFSPNGKWFVMASDEEFRVHAMDAERGPAPEAAHVAYCPDARILAYRAVVWATDGKAVLVTMTPPLVRAFRGPIGDMPFVAANTIVLRVWG